MNDNKNEINDKELENVNSGMKIIIPEFRNKLLDKIKEIMERIRKKQD